MTDQQKLTRAIERLAAAVEQLVAANAEVPPEASCVRCAGRGVWAPNVPCDACAGTGRQEA